MATSSAPFVECEQTHAGVTVSDIPAAVDFYTARLGFAPGFTWGDPPTFAGVNLGKVQMFLQKGTPEPKGCAVYFLVGDADMLYEFHRANRVDIAMEIGDREYGIRDYVVRDLHGYYLTFGHHLFNTGPSIAIDRVDVPVRLEKAARRPAPGPGEAQTHEREQLPGGDAPAHERRRRAAHADDTPLH
jgi:catechol 2,3-dioxygenase-like lactoylglutathione lyase family enzyme